jgi:hypothetical protein
MPHKELTVSLGAVFDAATEKYQRGEWYLRQNNPGVLVVRDDLFPAAPRRAFLA